jgi:hypothetical protein
MLNFLFIIPENYNNNYFKRLFINFLPVNVNLIRKNNSNLLVNNKLKVKPSYSNNLIQKNTCTAKVLINNDLIVKILHNSNVLLINNLNVKPTHADNLATSNDLNVKIPHADNLLINNELNIKVIYNSSLLLKTSLNLKPTYRDNLLLKNNLNIKPTYNDNLLLKNSFKYWQKNTYLTFYSKLLVNSLKLIRFIPENDPMLNSYLKKRSISSLQNNLLTYYSLTIKSIDNSSNNKPFIRNVKINPSYRMTLNAARTNFKIVHNLNFKYQTKLTRYLIKFKLYSLNSYLQKNLLLLTSVVQFSKLITNIHDINMFISNGLVFINGVTILTDCDVFKNDVIQLAISWQMYIYLNLWSFNLYSYYNIHNFKDDMTMKKKLNRIARIPYNFTEFFIDTPLPLFMNVDIKSLSIFILFDTPYIQTTALLLLLKNNILSHKLHNWKFLT